MSNKLKEYENKKIAELTAKKGIPSFRSGDTINVKVKIKEGDRSRIQSFEGVCIGKKNAGLNSSFTIRKISHGEGIERIFPLFSPLIDSIKIIRQGDVRRAKLYYLRDKHGKSARISDRDRGFEEDQYSKTDQGEEKIKKDEKEKTPTSSEKKDEADKNEKVAKDEKSAEEVIEKSSNEDNSSNEQNK